MNVLALCAGVGGLDLGIQLAMPSARVVCYVEGEIYAAAVLATRMEAGDLDAAPVYADLRTFDAAAWRGKVDCVTAGFPCQAFSPAARGRNLQNKDLWQEVARVVHDAAPEVVFLENTGLRAFRNPWADLRAMGYVVAPPFECSSAEVGAVHDRRRTFVFAYAHGESQLVRSIHEEVARISDTPEPWVQWPNLSGVVDGVQNRMDRDRALGNAVVPQQAAFAFRSLIQELDVMTGETVSQCRGSES